MKAYDLLVVGGGVQGLWVARRAIQAGLKVALVDACRTGAGASGGILGALMPHMPDGWDPKKQFQFEALIELEAEADQLREETGIDTGYVRCGRVMPVRTEGFRRQVEVRRKASVNHWQSGGAIGNDRACFEIDLLAPGSLHDWIRPEHAPLGLLWDSFAARIDPPQYVAALRAAIEPGCDVFEGWQLASFDDRRRRATSVTGNELVADRVILAAGYETFVLAEALVGPAAKELGVGIKGQAVLLSAPLPERRPVLYDDGMYVVAHTADTCAIGSTSEVEWDDATSTDTQIDARVAAARRVCPALANAKVVARWAGVRPKAVGRDPILGPLDAEKPVFIASGGFKITFGIAHQLASRLVDAFVGNGHLDGVPASFTVAGHRAAAARQAQNRRDAETPGAPIA